MYQSSAKVYELCQLFASMYDAPLSICPSWNASAWKARPEALWGGFPADSVKSWPLCWPFLGDPELLFFDELTTGLDPGARREIWEYVKELKREGRTVVMTTHYMEEAAILCDEICLINAGRIVAQGTVDEVIDQAQIDLVISFETDQDVRTLLEALTQVTRAEQHGSSVTLYTKSEQTLTELVLALMTRAFATKNQSHLPGTGRCLFEASGH